jgi:uncharacterized cupredoxin-like copper-binding protein
LASVSLIGTARAETKLHVDLWDKDDGTQGMTLSATEVPAGEVTIEVTNVSEGLGHEFLVVKTDKAIEDFPYKSDEDRVDESGFEGIEELGDIEEGESKSMTFDLTPGNYVLFCNENGHFHAGMWAKLTVTE